MVWCSVRVEGWIIRPWSFSECGCERHVDFLFVVLGMTLVEGRIVLVVGLAGRTRCRSRCVGWHVDGLMLLEVMNS